MTEIEKKAFKITLIRAFSILVSVIALTWQVSGFVRDIVGGMANLKGSIDQLIASNKGHLKKDSINDVILAKQGHDIDSLKKVLMYSRTMPPKPKIVMRYYRQRRVNGQLITLVN